VGCIFQGRLFISSSHLVRLLRADSRQPHPQRENASGYRSKRPDFPIKKSCCMKRLAKHKKPKSLLLDRALCLREERRRDRARQLRTTWTRVRIPYVASASIPCHNCTNSSRLWADKHGKAQTNPTLRPAVAKRPANGPDNQELSSAELSPT
jgi:hypothetical protein